MLCFIFLVMSTLLKRKYESQSCIPSFSRLSYFVFTALFDCVCTLSLPSDFLKAFYCGFTPVVSMYVFTQLGK